MTTPHALRDLAALIETIDDADLSIDGVRTPEGSLVDGRTLTAELTVRLDWGALDDVGSAVSVALPDGSEVEPDESGLALPLDVELDVGDGPARNESAPETTETAETAKTQVTDGGVAMVRSDGPADADPDREADPDATADGERTDPAEAGATDVNDRADEGETDEETGTTGRSDGTDAPDDDETATERDEEIDATGGDEETGTSEHGEQIDAEESAEMADATDNDQRSGETGTDQAAVETDADRTPDGTDADGDSEADAAPEPHRDPERLREAYESCDTFPEMAEALGASVTPQTVRYHAIELGIHRPNERPSSTGRTEVGSGGDESSSTASETESPAEATEADGETGSGGGGEATATVGETEAADPEGSEQVEAASTEQSDDGGESRPPELRTEDLPGDVDLPSHVTLADLRDAVSDATTLYEVQRDLRVDRSAARRLLRDLNLLDLVTGRAATADERGASAASIDERIRRACT